MLNQAVRHGAANPFAAIRALALASALATVFAFAFASTASADPYLPPTDLTLADLIDDDLSLTSLNEEVVFTNFAVEINGGSQNIEDYAIQQLIDGFKVTGPASPGEVIDIVLRYDVTTTQEDLALWVAGFTVIDSDQGVSSTLEAYNLLGQSILEPKQTKNGISPNFYAFTEVTRQAAIVQRMNIDLGQYGGGEWIVRNRFKTLQVDDIPPPVPEPNTALLLGFGIAGLARYARKRGNTEHSE